MKLIAVTQRIDRWEAYAESRDGLDRRWHFLLESCGLVPLLLPNSASLAEKLVTRFLPEGILLTGGNDLAKLGGTVPERDEVESFLFQWAKTRQLPLLGVCRGMQALVHHFGGELIKVTGHVRTEHGIVMDGKRRRVNSFHQYGVRAAGPGFQELALAEDGTIEAVRHKTLPFLGIMWHPEREGSDRAEDRRIIEAAFEEGL